MDINSILGSLGLGSKEKLYVSISGGAGMEVFQIDESTGQLAKYACRHIDYDYTTKEITDLEKFRETFLDLTSELGIKPSCNIVLNLPTVLLGTRELPTMLEDPAIGQSILAEIESSYIFSRFTPIFDWKDFDSGKNPGMRNIFYCALQDSVVSKLSEIFKDLGGHIVDIETSYTSILNGLARTNLIDKQLYPDMTWNLLIVNNGGYAIFSMVADKVVDFVQEEMTLMEERADDIYNAIVSTAELTLLGFPASSLVVVSESDMVNAEELANSLTSSGSLAFENVVFVDDNLYRKYEFIQPASTVDAKYKLKPSLKALGMLQGVRYITPIRFDFLKIAQKQNNDNEVVRFILFNNIVEITPAQAKMISIAVGAIFVVFSLAIFLIITLINKPFTSDIQKIEEQIQSVESEIQAMRGDGNAVIFDAVAEIKSVLNNNRGKVISYKSIGEFIPRKVWMTYYKAYDKNKLILTGVSSNYDDINAFYRDMNAVLPDFELKLKKLDMQNENGKDPAVADAQYYNFVITNDENYPPEANKEQPADGAEKTGKK